MKKPDPNENLKGSISTEFVEMRLLTLMIVCVMRKVIF
jgi:hypothetical protein